MYIKIVVFYMSNMLTMLPPFPFNRESWNKAKLVVEVQLLNLHLTIEVNHIEMWLFMK